MQTEESAAHTLTLTPEIFEKLLQVQRELKAGDPHTALEKSLNIAHFVQETLDNPDSKLLVERNGKFQELRGIA